MKSLYRRLTELINEPHDGEVFRRFLDDCEQQPTVVPINSEFCYMFSELGVSLDTLQGGRFARVALHIKPHSTADCKPYIGDFPANIRREDSRDLVEKKLGRQPIKTSWIPLGPKTKDLRESYDIPPDRISFLFDGNTGAMSLVSVMRRERSETRKGASDD